MVLKTISPGHGVRASLMLFFSFTSTLKLKTHSQLTQSPFMGTDCLLCDIYTCIFIGFKLYFICGELNFEKLYFCLEYFFSETVHTNNLKSIQLSTIFN